MQHSQQYCYCDR